MSRDPEPPVTEAERNSALSDLFYSANQCALYHFWFLLAKPALEGAKISDTSNLAQYFNSGITEAALLFIRKTTEFFKPFKKSDKPDTIYSYLYPGYNAQEWIVPEDGWYQEMHKRVGHITIRQARYGRIEWPIADLALRALRKWHHFFSTLAGEPVLAPDLSGDCGAYAQALSAAIARIELAIQIEHAQSCR